MALNMVVGGGGFEYGEPSLSLTLEYGGHIFSTTLNNSWPAELLGYDIIVPIVPFSSQFPKSPVHSISNVYYHIWQKILYCSKMPYCN